IIHLQVPAFDGACQPPTKSAAAAPTLRNLNFPVNSKRLMRGSVEHEEKDGRSGATTCAGRAWTATPSPTSAPPRTTCARWQTDAAWMASLSSTLLGSPPPRGG
ncbi:unnamed protein product, partial [Ectocarpus sp. 12 AP-2014]